MVSNAFLDAAVTNCAGDGHRRRAVPPAHHPGHRYQLSYNLRGPCAVGWWNGSVDPLSRRAQDLISGNDGAFFNGATNVAPRIRRPPGLLLQRPDRAAAGMDPDIWP